VKETVDIEALPSDQAPFIFVSESLGERQQILCSISILSNSRQLRTSSFHRQIPSRIILSTTNP